MKLLVPVLALGVLAVGVGSLPAQPRPAGDPPRLNLVGAHLSVDGERVLGPFSIQQG